MRIPGWPASLLLAALAFTAGCSSQRAETSSAPAAKRIILLTNGNSPFWDTARAGLNAAAKDLQLERDGFQAVLEVNDGTPQGQIDKLKQFASQRDIVAVGVSVIDAANVAVADEMTKLQFKGVHVITIDSDVDRDKFRDARFAFIGTDNLAGGIELGTAAKHLRPEGGQYVTFVGRTGAQNAIERVSGFEQGAGDKFEDLDNMADSIDHTRARENVNNAISNHPGLNVLVGIWSYNAPAIVDVVRRLDRRQDFTIVTFDAEPGAIKYMDDGFIDAMVVQNPFEMGYQGVRLMKALAQDDKATIGKMLPNNGEGDGGDIYDTGLKVVVPDEGSPLKGDMFGEKTEFLKLTDFKIWLAKYGLQGS